MKIFRDAVLICAGLRFVTFAVREDNILICGGWTIAAMLTLGFGLYFLKKRLGR